MQVQEAVHNLFEARGNAFDIAHADGSIEHFGDGQPQFTLRFREGDLLDLASGDPLMRFGEAYMNGKVDVEGDLADLVALAISNGLMSAGVNQQSMGAEEQAVEGTRSIERQREDIAYHYDLGNDFFRLWLDDSMTYSCAYFRHLSDTLEQAQRQKVEHSLRKLRLCPGQSLLDIGCGWGSLLMRAAEGYQADTVGITLSTRQQAWAMAEAQRKGLQEKVQVRLLDYGTLAREGRQFDRIVSIGMIEHVGKPHLRAFARAVETLLKPGGLALLHLITGVSEGPVNRWTQKYIFPGGYIPSFSEIIGQLAAQDFHIWDVENLGPHYRMTLDRWSERFENQSVRVREMFDERFVRMWRLYLRASSASFRTGVVEVHQILISRGQPEDYPYPPTRDDLYNGPQAK